MIIPFNKPFISGKELEYIADACSSGHLSGNGKYTEMCHDYLKRRFNFKKCLLTTSCTDALEMTALLIDIRPGDEVIVPSFTFVSTALAFTRQGAVIRFVDSRTDHPGIDEDLIEPLINEKTKAIVPVHYAGLACDMDKIIKLAEKYNLYVIEDNAHGIGSFYKEKPLGSIGHLACFSFHETKNIHCGEGGMLAINDSQFINRAEIIWEKGTNRAQFFRGESAFYEWKDTGSSFLPSEINAAFLFAQMEQMDRIQSRRIEIFNSYYDQLSDLVIRGFLMLPFIPSFATLNGNSFYIQVHDLFTRDKLQEFLRNKGIMAVKHYVPLHSSAFYCDKYDGHDLIFCNKYSQTIIRLPLFIEMTDQMIETVCHCINLYFEKT